MRHRPGTTECCAPSPYREEPHFAGSRVRVEELILSAVAARATVDDARGLSGVDLQDALYRYIKCGEMRFQTQQPRRPYVLVVSSAVFEDLVALPLVFAIVRSSRGLGLHLWIESAEPPPLRVAVELDRERCDECRTRGLGASLVAGVTH